MKIIYNENPLRTVVEVDEKDTEILLLKLKLEYIEDSIIHILKKII